MLELLDKDIKRIVIQILKDLMGKVHRVKRWVISANT